MRWFTRLRYWVIKRLGGYPELPPAEAPRTLYYPHPEPMFMPLDEPFSVVDWQQLASLARREPVFFKWLAHQIADLDRRCGELGHGPEQDRARLVAQVQRAAFMLCYRVGAIATDRLVELLRDKEKTDRQKGMGNNGG